MNNSTIIWTRPDKYVDLIQYYISNIFSYKTSKWPNNRRKIPMEYLKLISQRKTDNHMAFPFENQWKVNKSINPCKENLRLSKTNPIKIWGELRKVRSSCITSDIIHFTNSWYKSFMTSCILMAYIPSYIVQVIKLYFSWFSPWDFLNMFWWTSKPCTDNCSCIYVCDVFKYQEM